LSCVECDNTRAAITAVTHEAPSCCRVSLAGTLTAQSSPTGAAGPVDNTPDSLCQPSASAITLRLNNNAAHCITTFIIINCPISEILAQVNQTVSLFPVITRGVSLCFNSHFPDGSRLAGTRTSPFWILLQLRMKEVVATTGVIRRVQSYHHHQQSNTQFFKGWMSFLSPNQQCQSTEGKYSHDESNKL